MGAGLLARWLQSGMVLPGERVTGTGERRRWLLDDGSRLELNARSRVLPRFIDQQCGLVLRRGALLLDVAESPVSTFEITTAFGIVCNQAGQL